MFVIIEIFEGSKLMQIADFSSDGFNFLVGKCSTRKIWGGRWNQFWQQVFLNGLVWTKHHRFWDSNTISTPTWPMNRVYDFCWRDHNASSFSYGGPWDIWNLFCKNAENISKHYWVQPASVLPQSHASSTTAASSRDGERKEADGQKWTLWNSWNDIRKNLDFFWYFISMGWKFRLVSVAGFLFHES